MIQKIINRQLYLTQLRSLQNLTFILILSAALLLAQISALHAQNNGFTDAWYRGTLILAEGDTLTGDIHYELESDLVQISTNNTLKTYSARQIWSFQVYDPDLMADRRFFVLPYTRESSYKVPVLFELLTEGDISLLAREKLVTENIPRYNYWTNNQYYYTRTRLSNDYFFGFANGNIRRYDGSKQDFFYLVKDKSGDIKNFVKANKLRYDDKHDLIQIINFYNSIN